LRPIPIDEVWADIYQKVVIASPDGDLTNDEIRPVEVYVGPTILNGEMINTFFSKILLEPEDLELIAKGQNHFWLLIHGQRLQPFALAMEVVESG